jgi:hypothetical protein
MYCCSNCFSDKFLKGYIQEKSDSRGECPFCKSKDVPLIDPIVLSDRFEPLLNLYSRAKKGSSLIKLLSNDWNVFQIKGKGTQQKLLKIISDNPSIFKSLYIPVFAKEQRNIDQWEKFREELKHRNRFFPEDALRKTDIEPFGKYIGVVQEAGSQVFYRARINSSNQPHLISEMGKPDKLLVTSGRANPFGIPYLYVASSIATCLSEVRGHKGEIVTVAEFEIINRLELADLRDPRSTISPFELSGENDLEMIYKNIPFLSLLGNELSKPIIPRDANLEYLSSQYLCELLKQIGFHGIIYKSSVSEGNNYVIFNDDKLRPVRTFQYRITDILTSSEELF